MTTPIDQAFDVLDQLLDDLTESFNGFDLDEEWRSETLKKVEAAAVGLAPLRASPKRFRALADQLNYRDAGPSLEGYELVDGLRAAANLIEGKPGPMVHSDMAAGSWTLEGAPREPLSSLSGMQEEAATVRKSGWQ